MAAEINYTIPTQVFETIRDRIGLIITTELAKQYQLTSNTLFNAVVWVERFIAFDETEIPAVNIQFNRSRFTTKNHVAQTAELEYFIDVHLSATDSSSARGDVTATTKLHKLLGAIRYILSSAEYVTLGFTPGTVQRKEVTEIAIAPPTNPTDSAHLIMGRVSFTVQANEVVKQLEGYAVSEINSVAKLEYTEKGYKLKIENT